MSERTTWGLAPGQPAGGAVRRPADPVATTGAEAPPARRYEHVALVDLLDRVLAGGVVIMGDVRLAIADVDLVTISLQALISSVTTALGEPEAAADEVAAGELAARSQGHGGGQAGDW